MTAKREVPRKCHRAPSALQRGSLIDECLQGLHRPSHIIESSYRYPSKGLTQETGKGGRWCEPGEISRLDGGGKQKNEALGGGGQGPAPTTQLKAAWLCSSSVSPLM